MNRPNTRLASQLGRLDRLPALTMLETLAMRRSPGDRLGSSRKRTAHHHGDLKRALSEVMFGRRLNEAESFPDLEEAVQAAVPLLQEAVAEFTSDRFGLHKPTSCTWLNRS